MKRPAGYTLIELLVVMSIFALALGFVFYGFRTADRKESLRRTAQQVVERLQEMRTWSIANHQPSSLYWSGVPPAPTRVTIYGARFNLDDPVKTVQYSWSQDNNPSADLFIWDQRALIEPQLPFTSALKPWDSNIHIQKFRFSFDDAAHDYRLPIWHEAQVGFTVPESMPLVKFGGNGDGISLKKDKLFIYFEHQQFPGRCWEVIIQSAGEIFAKEAAC